MKRNSDGFDLGKDVAKTLLPPGTVEAGELGSPQQNVDPRLEHKQEEPLKTEPVRARRVQFNRTILPCSEKRRAEGMKKNRKR